MVRKDSCTFSVGRNRGKPVDFHSPVAGRPQRFAMRSQPAAQARRQSADTDSSAKRGFETPTMRPNLRSSQLCSVSM
jgi:hypothetical protein